MHPSIELRSRTVSFRPDLNVLVVRWHTLMPLEVVQEDYAQILVAAETHKTGRWLLDVRRRDQSRPELAGWLTTTYFPEAASRLAPLRLRLAVLNSPALTRAYEANADHKSYVAQQQSLGSPFELRLFENEGEAMEWLGGAELS